MTSYLAAFAGGLLGSAHCIGMCGGFVAIVGANRKGFGENLTRQLTYSFGRVFTYSFLGVVGGYAGGRISASPFPLLDMQRSLSIAAGVVMVLVGLAVLVPRFGRRIGTTQVGLLLTPVFRHFLGGDGRWNVFLAGVANGFLPCGLVCAFLALAVATKSPFDGLLMMTFFGAGTIPAMTLVGCGSSRVSQRTRLHIHRVAACLVIVAGGVTIERGLPRHGKTCCDEAAASVLRR